MRDLDSDKKGIFSFGGINLSVNNKKHMFSAMFREF